MEYARRAVLAVALAAATGVLPGTVLAQEKRIALKDLPAVVDSVFKATYPNAVIKGTATEVEDSVTFYEIESLDGKTSRDLLYTADGKVWEIEETVAAEALPTAVKHTLTTAFPKATVTKAEKTTRPAGVQFDLALKDGRKRIELSVDEQGKVLRQREARARNESSEGKEE